MLKRHYVTPENTYKVGGNKQVIYTPVKAYFAAIDERFKFFKAPYPTSTLIGVACLAMPEMLVEIEVEAIIETNRLRLPKGAVSR